VLLRDQGRTECLIEALNAAAIRLRGGDQFLVTFSGHGEQLPDVDGDEPDERDEAWVLYDRMFADDELFTALSRFAQGVEVVVVTDSGHGIVMPSIPNGRVAQAQRSGTDNSNLKASVLVISGARQNELALDGPSNGTFTAQLLAVLNDPRRAPTWKEVFAEVSARMPKTQHPTMTWNEAGASLQSRRALVGYGVNDGGQPTPGFFR
jgi:metacaspase-1